MTYQQAKAEAQKQANEYREPFLITFDKWWSNEFAESEAERYGFCSLALYLRALTKGYWRTFGTPEEKITPQ